MKEINSTNIQKRFQEYAKNKGYYLKVSGDYAYRNRKLKVMRYVKYNREDNTITVYEEGVGKFRIPFNQYDRIKETTIQKKLLVF